jgi:hypothetical protein
MPQNDIANQTPNITFENYTQNLSNHVYNLCVGKNVDTVLLSYSIRAFLSLSENYLNNIS